MINSSFPECNSSIRLTKIQPSRNFADVKLSLLKVRREKVNVLSDSCKDKVLFGQIDILTFRIYGW